MTEVLLILSEDFGFKSKDSALLTEVFLSCSKHIFSQTYSPLVQTVTSNCPNPLKKGKEGPNSSKDCPNDFTHV